MRRVILAGAVVLAGLTLAGCHPAEGDQCDARREKSYYSSHTENGKTKTVSLVCVNNVWRKA